MYDSSPLFSYIYCMSRIPEAFPCVSLQPFLQPVSSASPIIRLVYPYRSCNITIVQNPLRRMKRRMERSCGGVQTDKTSNNSRGATASLPILRIWPFCWMELSEIGTYGGLLLLFVFQAPYPNRQMPIMLVFPSQLSWLVSAFLWPQLLPFDCCRLIVVARLSPRLAMLDPRPNVHKRPVSI